MFDLEEFVFDRTSLFNTYAPLAFGQIYSAQVGIYAETSFLYTSAIAQVGMYVEVNIPLPIEKFGPRIQVV